MKPMAVLFDLDNTLVDRTASLRVFSQRLVTEMGVDVRHISLDEVQSIVVTADGGGYRAKDDFFSDLIAHLPWRAEPKNADMKAFYFQMFGACTVAKGGLVETLNWLRNQGLRIGMITNGSVAMQTGKIEQLSLQDHMDHITISEAVGIKKPAPGIFHHALQAMNISPDEAWFIGDHPINDVRGATDIGITAVWMTGSHRWPEASPAPPYTITHLDELIHLLDNVT